MKLINADALRERLKETIGSFYDTEFMLACIDEAPVIMEIDSPKKGAWVYRHGIYMNNDCVVKISNVSPRYSKYEVLGVYKVKEGIPVPSVDSNQAFVSSALQVTDMRVKKWIFNPKRNEIYIDPDEEWPFYYVDYKVYDLEATVLEVK